MIIRHISEKNKLQGTEVDLSGSEPYPTLRCER